MSIHDGGGRSPERPERSETHGLDGLRRGGAEDRETPRTTHGVTLGGGIAGEPAFAVPRGTMPSRAEAAARPPKEPAPHRHRFVHLRRESRNIGVPDAPVFLEEDVYYCDGCLDYARKPIREWRHAPGGSDEQDLVRYPEDVPARVGL